MIKTVVAIGIGAALGAIMRWLLGQKLNALYPAIPIGTLAANLIGGYLIGFFIAFFAQNTTIAPEWRLFIITGFMGGLTTFSTFSAEMVSLLQSMRISLFALGLFVHVGGSLGMTILGLFTFKAIAAFLR